MGINATFDTITFLTGVGPELNIRHDINETADITTAYLLASHLARSHRRLYEERVGLVRSLYEAQNPWSFLLCALEDGH